MYKLKFKFNFIVLSLINIVPYNDKSKKLISLQEHALFLLSPWNPYYNITNITNLYKWGHENFKSINFIIFDKPAFHNLRALGCNESKITKRIKKEINYLSNKCIRAVQSLGVNKIEVSSILKLWSDFEFREPFKSIHSDTKRIFEQDLFFKEECLKTAHNVIHNSKIPITNPAKRDHTIAVNYLIEEIPFLTQSPEIFNVSSSIWFYHKYNDFFHNLINEKFRVQVNTQQGAAVINFG